MAQPVILTHVQILQDSQFPSSMVAAASSAADPMALLLGQYDANELADMATLTAEFHRDANFSTKVNGSYTKQ